MRFKAALLALVTSAIVAACGGGSGGPFYPVVSPAPSSSAGTSTAAVSFLVVVPHGTASAHRKPNVTLPASAASVSFTVTSVNGTSYSGTATTEKLSASNASCTSVNGQLSCAFVISVPAGTDVISVQIYGASNTLISEGSVSVDAKAGTTVSAPLTLSGTVAKIVLNTSTGVAGVPGSFPVTVQAEDANGATILGTYTSPITLTDSDTSGATSLATSGSDNPPAQEVLSSSDSATLTYTGATLSSAASIGASASGVSASNVTPATFQALTHEYGQNGTITYGVTETTAGATNAPPASPYPNATTGSYAIVVTSPAPSASGMPTGVNGLIAVTQASSPSGFYGLVPPGAVQVGLSPLATLYYTWSTFEGSSALGYVGFSDPQSEEAFFLGHNGLTSEQCASPYQANLLVPVLPSWNVLSGSGACTTIWTDGSGDSETTVLSNDGSYTDSLTTNTNLLPGQQTIDVTSNGTASFSTANLIDQGALTVSTPSPNSTSIPVAFSSQSASPFFNAPAPTSALNPWAVAGAPNAQPPQPLVNDTMTGTASITSLPSQCQVASGLVPASNPPLSEAVETATFADPFGLVDGAFYVSQKITHYYLAGVGEVCTEDNGTAWEFGDFTYGNENFYSDNEAVGGALAFYLGDNTTIDSYGFDEWVYITQTTLTAEEAIVHDRQAAIARATAGLSLASHGAFANAMRHTLRMQANPWLSHRRI